MTGESELREIRAEITRLSGSGKRLSSQRTHGLYTSFTLPGLDDMPAVRDTRRRLDDFGVPGDLSGKTVIDVGANVGAVSLELARRGAMVTAVEFRQDRLDLIGRIQRYYHNIGHSDHCRSDGLDWFCHTDTCPKWLMRYPVTTHVGDLNDPSAHESPWARRQYDLVVCCSVDEYVKDRGRFYFLLRQICAGTLYLESNVQDGTVELETEMSLVHAGFWGVRYLGNGHSGGISRKRKLFTARGGL